MTSYPTCPPGHCWARAFQNARDYPELDYAQGWLTLAGSAASARPSVAADIRFRHAWNVIRATGEIVDPSRPPLYPGETYHYDPDPEPGTPAILLAAQEGRRRVARLADALEARGADPGLVREFREAGRSRP